MIGEVTAVVSMQIVPPPTVLTSANAWRKVFAPESAVDETTVVPPAQATPAPAGALPNDASASAPVASAVAAKAPRAWRVLMTVLSVDKWGGSPGARYSVQTLSPRNISLTLVSSNTASSASARIGAIDSTSRVSKRLSSGI